jgi:hypothetical protein
VGQRCGSAICRWVMGTQPWLCCCQGQSRLRVMRPPRANKAVLLTLLGIGPVLLPTSTGRGDHYLTGFFCGSKLAKGRSAQSKSRGGGPARDLLAGQRQPTAHCHPSPIQLAELRHPENTDLLGWLQTIPSATLAAHRSVSCPL